jgi:PAS domain S-box-containing protein
MNTLLSRVPTNSRVLALGGWRADGAITEANNALLSLTGYTQDEVNLGRVRWTEMTPQQYAPLTERALEQTRVKGSCDPFEMEVIRKDGRRVPILVGAEAIGGGIVDAGTFFAVDLTSRKSSELVRLNEASSELLGLTVRQRIICLLLSYGESEKQIASALDISIRTVELDKHRVAKHLGLPINHVVIWAVETRAELVASIKTGGISESLDVPMSHFRI